MCDNEVQRLAQQLVDLTIQIKDMEKQAKDLKDMIGPDADSGLQCETVEKLI